MSDTPEQSPVDAATYDQARHDLLPGVTVPQDALPHLRPAPVQPVFPVKPREPEPAEVAEVAPALPVKPRVPVQAPAEDGRLARAYLHPRP